MKSTAVINLVIVLMLIPLMLVGCSCNGEDTTAIKTVINNKWDEYNQGDYDMALIYCTNYKDKDKEIDRMTTVKNAIGNVTVQFIEDIYIDGPEAKANVTLYIAGQTYTDEVKLVKLYGGWKIDINVVDNPESAEAGRYTVQQAVMNAMLDFSVEILDIGGTVSSIACKVTYNNGTLLPIDDYIEGGIATLIYIYSVDTDGWVDVIYGPLNS